MSLTMARSDGVTVLTLTSDPSSCCSPLCQLLCYCPGLCSRTRHLICQLLGALYCPGLCSVKRRLPFQRAGAQAALGALWILTGLLHIGLGVILMSTRGASVYVLRDTYCYVWLGVLFLFFGVCCILAERYPRPIFVLLSGILNLAGVALSITAIVYYCIDIDSPGFDSYCPRDDYDSYYWRAMTTTASPEQSALRERCKEARHILRVLITSVRAVLVTLSVLDLCLGISSAVLSFKALKQGVSKSRSKPLLEETKETTEE